MGIPACHHLPRVVRGTECNILLMHWARQTPESLVLNESQRLQDSLTFWRKHSRVMPLKNWGWGRGELSSTQGTTEENTFPLIYLVLWPQLSQVNVILLATSYIAQCLSLQKGSYAFWYFGSLCARLTWDGNLCRKNKGFSVEGKSIWASAPCLFSITNIIQFIPLDSTGAASRNSSTAPLHFRVASF